jgi:site-specific recombinase XerC
LPRSATPRFDVENGTITIIGKGNRERRVFVPDEIKSLLNDYRTARDLCATTAETFLVNSRGTAAAPQMIRRLIRLHGERSDLRDRVTPPHVPPLGRRLARRRSASRHETANVRHRCDKSQVLARLSR